jgi:HIRAN domain-containing protein
MSTTWSSELEVVGLRFRWTKDGRRVLKDMTDKSPITGITLVREPRNQFDSNAIMVMLPQRVMAGRQLGYLHRQTAELLADQLDEGEVSVKNAKLIDLDASDDYSTGILQVTFVKKSPAKEG